MGFIGKYSPSDVPHHARPCNAIRYSTPEKTLVAVMLTLVYPVESHGRDGARQQGDRNNAAAG